MFIFGKFCEKLILIPDKVFEKINLESELKGKDLFNQFDTSSLINLARVWGDYKISSDPRPPNLQFHILKSIVFPSKR